MSRHLDYGGRGFVPLRSDGASLLVVVVGDVPGDTIDAPEDDMHNPGGHLRDMHNKEGGSKDISPTARRLW